MFSQSSFRPLDNLPPASSSPSRSIRHSGLDDSVDFHYNVSPGGSRLVTPVASGRTTPIEEEEEEEGEEGDPANPVHHPIPRAHPAIRPGHHHHNTMSSVHSHRSSGSLDRSFGKSLNDDSFMSGSLGRSTRQSLSPARPHPHHLNALSPLQAFSPLQTSKPLPEHNVSSNASVGSNRSRANSLTRSLSRRQSLIIEAEKWGKGEDEDDQKVDVMNLFSRLTLVKAPAEAANLRRAKSSSSISPFAGGRSLESNSPATTARGPRRSFAASSFAGFSPMNNTNQAKTPAYSPHGPDTAGRISQLHDRSGGDTAGVQRKTMSPEEVLDVARGLSSPVAIPEGGFKGAELKRRKSAGATTRRGTMETTPEKPPLALEPVEYVQLDDDTLLPFVDRPQEVAELMEHHSNAALFKLLKAAFPKDPAREHWQALSPDGWCWDEFVRHLTKLSRAECPDYVWIFRARQAVRARSVALWEKLGVCLGCDGDLLNAGGEDGSPPSWGGLSLGEEGEYDPSHNKVWIEGLEAVDPEEMARMERQLREEFGDIVEDEGEQAAAGMTALLGTVGEEPEEGNGHAQPQRTTAQREAHRKMQPVDPMDSPTFMSGSLPRQGMSHSPYTPGSPAGFGSGSHGHGHGRSKSFVGLQIMTSPVTQHNPHFTRSSIHAPNHGQDAQPIFDRGPGSPLFPSSFNSLSVEPNLGRSASVGVGGGVKGQAVATAFGGDGIGLAMEGGKWGGLRRKQSGAGLSESAITFASESDYSHSAAGDHDRHL